MPLVNIDDARGLIQKAGSGLARNGSVISASAPDLDSLYLCADIVDISGAANNAIVTCPVDGNLVAVYAVLSAATPGGTATFTIKVNGTGSTTLVFASGAALGDVQSNTSLAMPVTAGQNIMLDNDGGASNPRRINVVFVVEHTS